MIEFISFTIFVFLFFALVFKNILNSIKVSSLNKELLQSNIDKNILAEKLFEVSAKEILKKETDSDAFLKFVSDSRDVAYEYIEDAQFVLNKFIKDIEPEINYFKEYGDVSAMAPNYYSMNKIVECYEELKVLLPDDYGKIDT